MLISYLNDWLHSNPYVISGYEIRRANKSRFNVNERSTQVCRIHVVFGTEIHFWYVNTEHTFPGVLISIGFIDNDCVAFESPLNFQGIWPLNGDDVKLDKMSAGDPKFFDWFKNQINMIIKEGIRQNDGLDYIRET